RAARAHEAPPAFADAAPRVVVPRLRAQRPLDRAGAGSGGTTRHSILGIEGLRHGPRLGPGESLALPLRGAGRPSRRAVPLPVGAGGGQPRRRRSAVPRRLLSRGRPRAPRRRLVSRGMERRTLPGGSPASSPAPAGRRCPGAHLCGLSADPATSRLSRASRRRPQRGVVPSRAHLARPLGLLPPPPPPP